MSNTYIKTHVGYNVQGTDAIAACRQSLGDNDIFQQYHLRPWFTNIGRLYIRRDVATPAFITFLLLKMK